MNRQRPPKRPVQPLRRSTLALCIAALGSSAYAAEPEVATIVVRGQAAQVRRALDVQEAADNVISVVHADDIGALPDTNAAEALQRVPGVSIERDQGEGRYVRIRGLGPDLNSVTINGSLVPAPEADSRAVMMDVIPSALVRSLEVQKTLTPDQDANSIGGTVEVKTLSGFDHPGSFLSLEAGAGYDDNSGETSPKLAGTWSDRFLDGTLGVAAGVSWEKRKFGSDNVETGGKWDFDDAGNALLEEFERRDYQITRERLGGVLNLDWKPAKGQRYFVRTMLSRFTDEEERQAHIIEFDEAQAPGAEGDAESSRELKQRKETQTIQSITLGTEQKFGDWKLDLAFGSSRSGEDTPDHIAGAVFEGNDAFGNVGFRDTKRPDLFGPASLYDANAYSLKEVELARSETTDKEHNLRVDLSHKLVLADAGEVKFKFGAKASRREKRMDEDIWTFEDLDEDPASLSDAQLAMPNFVNGTVDWRFGQFGPRISAGAVQGLIGGLDRNAYYDEEASRVNDFLIKEDINAGYLQAAWRKGAWYLLGGVRYEGTRLHTEGTGVRDGSFEASTHDHDYGNWLPALHLRHELDDATSIRAAWTNSVVRPTFGQLAPGFVIDGDEASFGNPDLKPWESSNLDLGIERRLGEAGVVSAYLFNKQIRNFVYATDLAGSGDWIAFDQAETYANGDKATVRGLELAYSQAFKQLPAPWNGLLLGVNATFSQSKATIQRYDADAGANVSREVSLPSQSDLTANLMLGYEAGPMSVRLAANYKSEYLLEVGNVQDARSDQFVDAQTQFDLSARYALGKQTQLVFEVLNIGDEPYYVYSGERSRNAQYEQYGRTYKLGLKFTLY